MKTLVPGIVAAALLLVGCRTASREVPALPAAEPAPMQAATAATVAPQAMAMDPSDTLPDVRFLRHMIAHHAQAMEMSALVPTRSRREDMRLLAERIAVSQREEIAFMERWLGKRGVPVATSAAGVAHAGHAMAGHHGAGHDMSAMHASMPGMVSPAEMDSLARASGPEFDAMFLRYMIRHHEGALAMAAAHLATPGAARESELFSFVSDIDADQRAEIRRMRALQARGPE